MKRLLSLLLFSSVVMAVPTEQVDQADPLYEGEMSKNFLIRWAFQDFCDYVFDPRTDKWVWPTNSKKGVTFDPKEVRAGDIIFVRDAELFFCKMHPKISEPYIIVTHGEHLDQMKRFHQQYLDEEKVIAWFGVHPCKMEHPKYQPVPIGVLQQPDNYKRKQELHDFLTNLRLKSEKKHLLYMNFADWQKPERKKVKAMFIDKKYCKRGERLSFHSYLKEMAQCKFTLSPKGLAPDCYRTWEALLVGSIPVIRKSQLDVMFEGLPVLLVDEWEEIDEDYLNKKYEEFTSKKYDIKRLYMEYWTDKIMKVKEDFLAEHRLEE